MRDSAEPGRRLIPLDPGRVFGLTLSASVRNLPRLALVSLIVFSPTFVLGWLAHGWGWGRNSSLPLTSILVLLDVFFLHHLLTAAVVTAVSGDLKGRPLGVIAVLRTVAVRAGNILVLGWWSMIGLGFCFALFLIPGIWALVVWCTVVPVLMVERVGPGEALVRSRVLSRGSRRSILAILFILFIANWCFTSVLLLPMTFLLESRGGGPAAFLVGQLVLVGVRTLLAVLSAVIYRELRVGREGLEIVELGAVFD